MTDAVRAWVDRRHAIPDLINWSVAATTARTTLRRLHPAFDA